jgi:hypothetical protein
MVRQRFGLVEAHAVTSAEIVTDLSVARATPDMGKAITPKIAK